MEKTKVAIVGLGTVGTGVAKILLDQGDRTARHAGRTLWLQHVVTGDLRKARQIDLPAGLLSDDLNRITGDPEIRCVAVLVGGLEPDRTITLKLLEAGKDVITANKALLAEHGPELFDRARELGRSIAFEAAVAGGIPIVATISQHLTANQIQSLDGILNGTSNFILSQMDEKGVSYESALGEAQRLGYAEADPAMDVDGSDAAQKLAILAHLSFGTRVDWRDIPRRGIDTVRDTDMRFARELGYRIKLLAVAQLVQEGLELHVSPTLVRVGTPLAEVRKAYNAISVVGDAVGRLSLHGLGAGQMPTASAVVSDMIDTVVGRAAITFKMLALWSQSAPVRLRDFSSIPGRFYLRFDVEDRPGVMADVCTALGRHGISIASIIQHEPQETDSSVVPLVIMTHNTSEGAADAAIRDISALTSVRTVSERMRVRE